MTASWSFDGQPRTGDPLLPGAAPAAIRDALLPEDRVAFETAYQHALTRARDDLDLTELFQTLERWRRLALLQRDPARFASVARRPRNASRGQRWPRTSRWPRPAAARGSETLWGARSRAGSLTSGDRRSDMIPACRCGCCT